MPRIRFGRKVVIVSFGMLALLGGSGAAALYVGADKLIGERQANAAGGECTTIQTMVLKTPAKRLWLRKYVRMDNADAATRIRTALRVAGVLAKSNPVDLVQVSVLDARGPDKRARMRGRAIGAEVVIALEPRYLPDMAQPFMASYYDGLPNAEGYFYGHKVKLQLDRIQKLMTAMKSSGEELEGCTEPERPSAKVEGGHGAPASSHGEQVVSEAGEHGAKPEASGHEAAGEEAKSGHSAAEPPREQSFLDSVLSMVGLGASTGHETEGEEAKVEQPKPESAGEEAAGHEPAVSDAHGAAADDEGEAKAEVSSHSSPPLEQDAH